MANLPILLFREHQLHLFKIKGKHVSRLDLALTTPLQLAGPEYNHGADTATIIEKIRTFTDSKPLKVLLDFQDIDCQEANEFPRFAKRFQLKALTKRYLEQHTRKDSVATLLPATIKGDRPMLVQAGLTAARQNILSAIPISNISIAPLLLPTIMGSTPTEPTLYLCRYDSGRMRLTFYNNNQLYFTRLSPPQADYNKEVQDTIYYCRQHMANSLNATMKPNLVTVDAEHCALPVEDLDTLTGDIPLLLALASQKKPLPNFTSNMPSMAINPVQPMAKWWLGTAAILALLIGTGIYQVTLQQRDLAKQQQRLEAINKQQQQFTDNWQAFSPTEDENGEPLVNTFTEEQQFRATLVQAWLEQQRLSYQDLQRALGPLPANRYYLQSFILEQDHAIASDSAVRRLLEERGLAAISNSPPVIQFGEYELSFAAPAVFAGQLTVSYDDQLNMQQLLSSFPEWLTVTLEQDALDIWGGAKSGALGDIDLFDTQRLLRLTMVGYQELDDKSAAMGITPGTTLEQSQDLNLPASDASISDTGANTLEETQLLLEAIEQSDNTAEADSMGVGELGQPGMADAPLEFEEVPPLDIESLSPLQPLEPNNFPPGFMMEAE